MTGRLAALAAATMLVAWVAAGLPATPPDKDPPLHFEDGLRVEPNLPPSAYSPHPLKGGSDSEIWEYALQLSGGLRMLVAIRITNIGPGSDHAQVAAATVWSDGKLRNLINNGREKGEWTLSTDAKGFTLGVAKHTIRIASDRHHLLLDSGNGIIDLDAEPIAPAFRAGRVAFGRSDFYDLTIVAPRLAVKGTLVQADGRRQDLGEGTGIMMHTRTTLADYDRALATFAFHSFDGPAGLSFIEFTEPDARQRVGLLLVVEDHRVTAWPGTVARTYEGLAREDKSPRYTLPAAFTLAGTELSGRAALKLIRRDDILAQISSAIFRLMIRFRTHPVQYMFAADYRFSIGRDEEARVFAGTGLVSLFLLNAPPSNRPW